MAWAGWSGAAAQRRLRELAQPRRKYGNRPHWVTVDGLVMEAIGDAPRGAQRFDSKAEALRFVELDHERRAGRISDLTLQKEFGLHAMTADGVKVRIGSYICDFAYLRDGRQVIEDVKGMATPLFRWKAKHFMCETGLAITLVG